MTAQFVSEPFRSLRSPANHFHLQEHTIILRPTCKEVVSRGDDY